MQGIAHDVHIIILLVCGTLANYKHLSDEKDLIRVPLPTFLQKILVGCKGLVDREQKSLIKAKRPGISLAGFLWHVFIAILFFIWASYFFGIDLFEVERQLVLDRIAIAGFMGFFVVFGYDVTIEILYAEMPTTTDKRYQYRDEMRFSKKDGAFNLRLKNVATGEKSRIFLPLPENAAISYDKLFSGKFDWWVVLENADSISGYQYIATIGLWDFNKPHRLLEYAVNVEKGTSVLIRDYIENPEEQG